jgi:PAS domain S-box-containing protein
MDRVNYLDSMFDKFQMIFDHSPLGISITEIDGSVTMNNTFCAMLGYTQTELLEADWKDIIYKEDMQKYHELFNIYSTDNNGTIIIEIRFVKKNAAVIWAEVTSNIKNDEEGKPVFLLSMIKDISEYKIIQEKLKQNESRYKELFENNPNPMWLYDTQSLKFLMVNHAAVANYGYSYEEFLGMTIKDIRPQEDIPDLLSNLNGIDTTINESETWRHKKKDGSIILVKVSSHSIRLNGYIARVIMALDVTEKVTAKQNLVVEVAKLKSIIESTSDAIFAVDKNYCYTTFNSVHSMIMKKLCNVNIEIGRSMPDYLPTENERLASISYIDRALNGETVNEILITDDEIQSKVYFDIRHNPIKNENGEIIGVSVFTKDITDRKNSEQALIAAKEKAEEINRVKSIFFSNMSHELRTPLVGILGFADILSNNLDDEDFRTMASSILKSGKRLLTTLTSLMNLSELETLKHNVEIVDVDANLICTDLINHYQANSTNPNVEFKTENCSDPLNILINSRLLRESLTQLLNNAATYTEKGSVTIRTYKRKTDSDKSAGIIEIIDTGIGIPCDKQKVIFDEFRQVSEGYGRDFEGTGLGLTLTKKYVELMSGSIELKSEAGKGTTVTLSFPVNQKYEATLDEENLHSVSSINTCNINKEIKSDKKNRRILIVEDDVINKAFLEKCFAKVCSIKSVSSGAAAIQSAVEEKFDLLLMDINLQNGMNGITATQAIRKISGYEIVPIVAMTAYTAPEEKEEFLSKGCSHYIAKPFIMNELLTLVNEIFEAV